MFSSLFLFLTWVPLTNLATPPTESCVFSTLERQIWPRILFSRYTRMAQRGNRLLSVFLSALSLAENPFQSPSISNEELPVLLTVF